MKKIQILNSIAQIIYDKKGFNITCLDVQDVSSVTDYLIIAEGNIERHTKAIVQEIVTQLKKVGEKPIYVEGMDEADWIVIDYLNIIVHLFKPALREKYELEKLFQAAKIVDLEIEVGRKGVV